MGGSPTSKTSRDTGPKRTRSQIFRIVRRLSCCFSSEPTASSSSSSLRGGATAIEEFITGTPEVNRRKGRLPIEELAEKRPALLEAPIAYLQVYLSDGQNRERHSQRSPMLYFALAQCSLTYRFICARLQKKTLKATMLRESMANLMMLLQVMGGAYPEIAEPVGDQMHKFIAILEDLDRLLGELSNLAALNWQTISTIISTMVQEQAALADSRSFTEFVPSIEDFVQVKLLGKGAFGAVYRARFKGELDVAVKVVPQQRFRDDPKDDAQLMDKMVGAVISNHPYICRILCAFVANTRESSADTMSSPCSTIDRTFNVLVTVMESISGVDLTELIGKHTALSFNLVQMIMQQCMMAVEHLHFAGFVHRDIKPANMLLTRYGRLKLIDFDVSRVCIGHFSGSFQSSYFGRTAMEFVTGDKAGTEAYMAPEVHQGKHFGRASDWWSVGIVHYRLAFGRLPFRQANLAAQIVNQEIDWEKVGRPGDVQVNTLKNYLSKLLVKEPRGRLGSHDYADIFDHPLFSDTNWARLPELDLWCEELDAAFAERSSTTMEKEKGSVLPDPLKRDDLPSLKALTDNVREHLPLMTFSSKLIKRMVGGDGVLDEYEDPPYWRHITELKKSGDDTTSGTTMADNLQRKDPVQVIIQNSRGARTLCKRQRRPVALRRLLSEDGMFRYLVSDVATNAKIISDSKLFYGDLVLEVDKTPLINLPEHRVAQLLSRKGSPLVFSVAQGNPFRDAGEAALNLSKMLFRFKPLCLTTRGTMKHRQFQYCRRAKIAHGFSIVVRKVWSCGTAEMVCFVESHEVAFQRLGYADDRNRQGRNSRDDKDSPNIYAGDIVLAINKSKPEQLTRGSDPEKYVRELMATVSFDIDVLPCSPLRLGNLYQI